MRFIAILLLLAGCSTIDQLNSNMQNANEIMLENVHTMEVSRTAIEENTRQIERSTQTVQNLQHISLILFAVIIFLALVLLVVLLVRRRRKVK